MPAQLPISSRKEGLARSTTTAFRPFAAPLTARNSSYSGAIIIAR